MWDVSPYTLYEHSALPSRHKQPGLLTCAICLFYECLPRALSSAPCCTAPWEPSHGSFSRQFPPLLMSPNCSIHPGPELACVAMGAVYCLTAGHTENGPRRLP